jgi:hypothetical protein
MSHQDFDASQEQMFAELNSPASVKAKQMIAELQHSHELRYQTINLEAWALAQTMDEFLPGFWSRFLENRHRALQQFLKNKQTGNFQVIKPYSRIQESGVRSQK